jgi:hypothetical protein
VAQGLGAVHAVLPPQWAQRAAVQGGSVAAAASRDRAGAGGGLDGCRVEWGGGGWSELVLPPKSNS